MIVFVKGKVVSLCEEWAVVECQGLGYRIFMPTCQLTGLRLEEDVMIHTYYHIREDAALLYGFRKESELRLFRLLIGVSGIGPKAGLGILSVLSPEEVQFAVLAGDAATICKAPGIGKKTAQKLILELKDKLSLQETFEDSLQIRGLGGPDGEAPEKIGTGDGEAVEALVSLGYSASEALRAVRSIEAYKTMAVEDLIKAALRKMI